MSGSAPGLAPEVLAVEFVIGTDWLERCLRIAGGLLPAPAHRVREATGQLDSGLGELADEVRIAADLPRWLATATDH